MLTTNSLRAIVMCLLLVPALPLSANALKNHVSPYLAMHGNDPVDWHEWNAQTVALAQKQGKLLFVSSGYFSCHWCHVMQRESYQNQDIARFLNTHFIPVKVDRELEPALDAHLIDFVERTQGISGWPLNAFVTPEGYPLVGMVYVPPENFKQILVKLDEQWRKENASLRRVAQRASEELSKAVTTQNTDLPTALDKKLMGVFSKQALAYADTLQGGFGQENKFPSVPQLMTLLETYQSSRDETTGKFLTLTLDHMATQGLRDQLGGGFYRYVVDPGWQIPHFEKMLYDNALLALLYYRAGEVFSAPHYTAVASDTLDFILKELATDTPAYAASLSAIDDKGIEGGYYLWHMNELSKLLSKEELAVVKLVWQTDGPPDLEYGHHLVQAMTIPNAANKLKLKETDVSTLLSSAAKKMRQARAQRILPKDDKILTSWNGLTLSALVSGAKLTGSAVYRDKATALADFMYKQLWDQKRKLLHKAKAANGPVGEGALEDYAYLAQGLYALWLQDKNPQTESFLNELLQQAWQRFYGKQGWQLAENMLLKYDSGRTALSDGPLPAASGVLIKTSYQFALTTGNLQLRDMALRALNVGHAEIETDAFWFATQISALQVAGKKLQ